MHVTLSEKNTRGHHFHMCVDLPWLGPWVTVTAAAAAAAAASGYAADIGGRTGPFGAGPARQA